MRRAGLRRRAHHGRRVSIPIRSEDRMRLASTVPLLSWPVCFNPHPVRRPDATHHAQRVQQQRQVSIPIRSEDRMRPRHRGPLRSCGAVSIPIRSEDRMRPAAGPDGIHANRPFQSPSGPKTGCDWRRRCSSSWPMFVFQSPSGPKTGCDGRDPPGHGARVRVSIPIRSEDRMRLALCGNSPYMARVSIPIRSEDRMRQLTQERLGRLAGFQSPSGPKTGCDSVSCLRTNYAGSFQSPSGPKTGCDLPYTRGRGRG